MLSNIDETTAFAIPPEKKEDRYLDGELLSRMARGGAAELRTNAEEVNHLNVFPVPDGDTGDNMCMTIESGVAALDKLDESASLQETAAVGNDFRVVHEQTDHTGSAEPVHRRYHRHHRQYNAQCKEDRIFHPFPVSAGIIIADQRHDSLGETQTDLHRQHIDLV